MDAIEKIAREFARLTNTYPWDELPNWIREALIRATSTFSRALNAAGFAIVSQAPTQSAMLLLGLLSGAGPQSREQYAETLDAIIKAQEVRPDAD